MLLVDTVTPQHRIRLSHEEERGLCLYLGDTTQFVENDEHRYHESLAVVPCLFRSPRRVLIAGGGDGLAATRVLRFPSVESVVVCDYDETMTRLARDEPALAALNARSLADPRTRVVNDDAFAFLRRCRDRFDLILCDFPDPYLEPLGRLYSKEFYRAARARLGAGGMLVTQACMIEGSVSTIHATIASVFPHVAFYRTFFARPAWGGFVLGANRPLGAPAPVPEWTRYLNDAVVASLFAMGKDEGITPAPVNTVANETLVRRTLLAAFGGRIGCMDAFDEGRFVATLDSDTVVDPTYVWPLLAYAADERRLSVRVADAWRDKAKVPLRRLGFARRGKLHRMTLEPSADHRARLEARWASLDDSSVVAVETHDARERPDEARHLGKRGRARRSRKHTESQALADTRSYRLVARGRQGGVVAIARVAFDDEIEVRLSWATNDPRKRELAALLLFGFALREWDAPITLHTAGSSRFFERLGFVHRDTYAIYEPAR